MNMKQEIITYLIIIIGMALLAGCSDSRKTYKIAVSQCSAGNWRYQMNRELLTAQHLYDENVEVEILNCYDNSDVQVRQIDSLADAGIDLLVVAPNEYEEVAPALKRTKAKGIPVILFDRKAETNDYTAFIGGDNVVVGTLAANYALQLASQTENRRVVEIAALQTTSPSRDRHMGFEAVMRQHPEVNYRCIFGDWDDNHTGDTVSKLLKGNECPDVVFCHSDFMASGAWRAVSKAKMDGRVKIIGVDALSGPGDGIEAVQKGQFAGTCTYPTNGEKIVKLALDILTGKPYERENTLKSMMVTPDNVEMVALYSQQLTGQASELVTIQDKLESYFGLYNLQTKILWVAALVIVLLVVAVGLTWTAVHQLRKAHRRMKLLNKEQTLFYTNASHQLKTPLTLIAGPVRELKARNLLKGEDEELLEIADNNITQLESVLTSVLNFRKDMTTNVVSDDTAGDALQQSADIVKEEHLNMMKQEDSEELANILVIEDNHDMRRYLRTLLASRFYVLEASDGQSGLKLARESVPDLIISDVMMPVMDGLQLCKSLKEDYLTSHIPVILLTARSTEAQQMEGYEHGADAYLTKPFRAELLISRIDNLLHSRQQLRHIFDGKQQEEEEVKLTTQDKLFLDGLKDAIRESMSNPNMKMDDLGEKMGISRVQLYRKVKVLTGLSPVELLRQMRLERGKTLLNTTTKTVAEIAYEVGFGTPSYFTSCFKKQYGKLPMEYRAVN